MKVDYENINVIIKNYKIIQENDIISDNDHLKYDKKLELETSDKPKISENDLKSKMILLNNKKQKVTIKNYNKTNN